MSTVASLSLSDHTVIDVYAVGDHAPDFSVTMVAMHFCAEDNTPSVACGFSFRPPGQPCTALGYIKAKTRAESARTGQPMRYAVVLPAQGFHVATALRKMFKDSEMKRGLAWLFTSWVFAGSDPGWVRIDTLNVDEQDFACVLPRVIPWLHLLKILAPWEQTLRQNNVTVLPLNG